MKSFGHSVVMIAGDSGDGIQLLGHHLTYAHARFGHVVQTISEFPAEIRAPAGTIHGVSGFRLAFSSRNLGVVPQHIDYAVVFNPAAFLAIRNFCTERTTIIFDRFKWTEKDWKKAGSQTDPLLLHTGPKYPLDLTDHTQRALPELPIVQARKNRNMCALGLMLWLHELDLAQTQEWLEKQFQKNIAQQQAILSALKAGYYLGETLELPPAMRYALPAAVKPAGRYVQVSGHQSLVLGMLAAAQKYQKKVVLAGYPITPASELLHIGAAWSDCGIEVVQAEDEIAAAGIALGASYAGALGVTCTSGPGLDLKAEMIGLALMAEVPMVIIDIQRAGPSTGMPTKTEQGDLLSALYGRHGHARIPVLAQARPEDGRAIIEQAFEWAIASMMPVIVLSDALLAQGTAPILVEKSTASAPGSVPAQDLTSEPRKWIIPGTPGGEQCIGGLEKDRFTGEISYDGANHAYMTQLRKDKVTQLARPLPAQLNTPLKKGYLWVGMGSVTGALEEYFFQNPDDHSTHIVLREIDPLPSNFWQVASEYTYVIAVELADEQLARYLKSYGQHARIISYSQTDASALDLQRLSQWFCTWKKENEV